MCVVYRPMITLHIVFKTGKFVEHISFYGVKLAINEDIKSYRMIMTHPTQANSNCKGKDLMHPLCLKLNGQPLLLGLQMCPRRLLGRNISKNISQIKCRRYVVAKYM